MSSDDTPSPADATLTLRDDETSTDAAMRVLAERDALRAQLAAIVPIEATLREALAAILALSDEGEIRRRAVAACDGTAMHPSDPHMGWRGVKAECKAWEKRALDAEARLAAVEAELSLRVEASKRARALADPGSDLRDALAALPEGDVKAQGRDALDALGLRLAAVEAERDGLARDRLLLARWLESSNGYTDEAQAALKRALDGDREGA